VVLDLTGWAMGLRKLRCFQESKQRLGLTRGTPVTDGLPQIRASILLHVVLEGLLSANHDCLDVSFWKPRMLLHTGIFYFNFFIWFSTEAVET
jgi:hypothetical protein